MRAQRSAGVAGALLFLLGATIAGWGLVIFRRARTTTVPGRASAALVTWGPYRFSRNPMYVGLTLAYLGEAGLLRQAVSRERPPLDLVRHAITSASRASR